MVLRLYVNLYVGGAEPRQNQNQSYIGMLQSILGTATISQTWALQYGLQAWSVVALYQGVPGEGKRLQKRFCNLFPSPGTP